ncbi:MAG: GNAT family N-acetyltransferase [Sedimentisphaerales bacterium]|nr:GNAT family N-acetyltransferase [Sedimentisphaerales bacterium]
MSEGDIDVAAALVARAMNPDEGRWAARTMGFHFGCQAHGLDDGRSYFVKRQGGTLVGLVGLHHAVWGPEENVWLAWFAVDPDWQGKGLGRELLTAVERIAMERGFRKLLVETYEHADFDKARRFYERSGFRRAGEIANYLPDGAPMVVYAKRLGQQSQGL